MTPEERLSQAEILLKTAAKNINSNAEAIKELRESQKQTQEQMRRMSEIVVDTIGVIRIRQNQFTQMQGEIIEIRTEIRGLQKENQRMLGYLFGERGDSPPESEN